MGKQLKAWELAERVLGKRLSDHLRNGGHIDIKAPNGMIYRINGKKGELYNLTTREKYCVHPSDVSTPHQYPFPDLAVLWWTYLHHKPEVIERKVGKVGDGHRTPIKLNEEDIARLNVFNAQEKFPAYIGKIMNKIFELVGSNDISFSDLKDGDLDGRRGSEEGWYDDENEEGFETETESD